MNASNPRTVTALLTEMKEGNQEAFNRLYENVYEELRHLAAHMKSYNAGNTLNTTSLVHEAYIKLIPSQDRSWENRTHFFRVAARAMRQVLINYARYKKAEKRGEGIKNISFDEALFPLEKFEPEDFITLDQVLTKLESIDTRQAQVAECRIFTGMTIKDTADTCGISEATVKRDWRIARAWLIRELGLKNPEKQ